MLWLLAFAAIGAESPASPDVRCPLQAEVAGDLELVESVSRELERAGRVRAGNAPEPGCAALTVHVERRGAALHLFAAEPSGDAMEREASSASIAAMVIEAWAMRASAASEGQAIAEFGPKQGLQLRPSLLVAHSFEDQTFFGASVAVTSHTGPIVYGLEGYYLHGAEDFFGGTRGIDDGAVLFTVAYAFAFDDWSILPELGIGAGVSATSPINAFQNFTQPGMRERIALRTLWSLSPDLDLDASLSMLISADPRNPFKFDDLDTISGLEDGIVSFGLNLGFQYAL